MWQLRDVGTVLDHKFLPAIHTNIMAESSCCSGSPKTCLTRPIVLRHGERAQKQSIEPRSVALQTLLLRSSIIVILFHFSNNSDLEIHCFDFVLKVGAKSPTIWSNHALDGVVGASRRAIHSYDWSHVDEGHSGRSTDQALAIISVPRAVLVSRAGWIVFAVGSCFKLP